MIAQRGMDREGDATSEPDIGRRGVDSVATALAARGCSGCVSGSISTG